MLTPNAKVITDRIKSISPEGRDNLLGLMMVFSEIKDSEPAQVQEQSA